MASSLRRAVERAEGLLPGRRALKGEVDPRWQAIIQVGQFIESDPEGVWEFALRWGKHAQADVRMAVATCLLEHLLEHHFEMVFPRVREETRRSVRFAETFGACWEFGQAMRTKNLRRMEKLRGELKKGTGSKLPVAQRRKVQQSRRRVDRVIPAYNCGDAKRRS